MVIGMNLQQRRRPAVAATELAILLPFMALVFTLVLDFGRVFHYTQTLQQSAAAGALRASGLARSPSSMSAEQSARDAACACASDLSPALLPENVTLTTDQLNKSVTVTVEFDFELFTPLLSSSSTVRLHRSATFSISSRPGD